MSAPRLSPLAGRVLRHVADHPDCTFGQVERATTHSGASMLPELTRRGLLARSSGPDGRWRYRVVEGEGA